MSTKELKNLSFIVLGAVFLALAINIFLVPNQVAVGGVPGIAIIFYYLFHFNIGLTIFLINIPLVLIGARFIGRHLGPKSIMTILLISGFTDLFALLPPVGSDLFLGSIFGGVFVGLGVGLIIKGGGSTGGVDVIARILNKIFPHVTIGTIMLLIDACIIASITLIFQNIIYSLYGVVATFIISRVIDFILQDVKPSKTMLIISQKAELIIPEILDNLERGATRVKAMGAYTKKDNEVILSVVSKQEAYKLKEIIKKIDPVAFVVILGSDEVMGRGFTLYKNYEYNERS